ncbi:restriction endonuclease subunit S [Staphylococcus epidermidis]|uniref:restriction endonuclease subunit S n=2 Tax=Staphylococcus epidermidis TaxID=1282 RepID=UPI00193C1E47|nr:restriction endonuclease subunit S [Staphylococcus epidermidis]MBM6334581.1 restriction endonuclease subunit S [Staphylococcus epidermidis]MBM6341315.1 restriction endonuclease subunit S [Staphylococcus epidermidis]MBM6356440.1 restriction endonuclease subunit S [Staphylococcus epidermidis]MCG1382334.1 restriction endonuclease subunit S [Staphylococcus epidermidis]MCG1443802.1 restriction endonuclease subunit S [Staphylococcus epidermidis]
MEYKLGNLSNFYDSLHKTPKVYSTSGYPMIRVKDIETGFLNISQTANVSEVDYLEFTKKYKPTVGDIIITRVGTYGNVALVVKDENFCLGQNTVVLNPIRKTIDNKYLFYALRDPYVQQQIESKVTGSTQKTISLKSLKEIEVKRFDYKKEILIGKFLYNIDNKIEINKKIIANLEELSQTLFKRWFVDFEFPDEDGNPYKSSGGEMVDSELGEIPKNWSIKIVKEIAESFNSIRKPLSKLEREKRESIYPYYGATKIIDYVDNYIFDGKYILVGEDGTVQTETGNPFIQYVWGKFWVSNHAHILKGKLISDELLMLYLKNTNVVPYITGAVQPKLNKKNLNSIKFVIADKETIIKFENFIKSYFQKIRILNKENKKLIELRDTLLPKLMSGELEIPDDVEVNTDELSI